MKVRGKSGLLSALWATVLFLIDGVALGAGPVAVSPGNVGNGTVVAQDCPTFSWSAADGARGYRIEVYEKTTTESLKREDMNRIASAVVSEDIEAPALSWTPSSGECLRDGVSYVWYVGAEDREGHISWSDGKGFEVSLLSGAGMASAVEKTVKNYLSTEWRQSDSYAQVKEEIRKEAKGDSGIAAGDVGGILGFEGGSNTLYGQNAGQWIMTNNGGTGPPDYNTFIGASTGYYTASGANSWDGDYNTFIGHSAGYSNSTGQGNTFVGYLAGRSNTTGYNNVFMGYLAGFLNTTGIVNTFLGNGAGGNNSQGSNNVAVGNWAGGSNISGSYNVSLGHWAGYSNNGSYNVFLGSSAGFGETASNRLYIDNSSTGSPLIYGEFDNDILTVNGKLGIGTTTPQEKVDLGGGALTVNGADTTGGTGPGMRKPSVGWTENGRMIMGYGGAGGGNLELYSKGHATRAGEFYFVYGGAASTGKVKFAHYDGASWNTRMTILYNGYVGIGTDTQAYPIHLASGARVTAGGVWTDASSREYKENIKTLSADSALTALKGLEPVTFNYKADREETHAGFIAEDVPELVATKDRKSLSPMDIVAVLTKVVKEQQQEIENLKRENQVIKAELKDRITAIERRLRTTDLARN